MARVLLFQAQLPARFWGKYVLTAGYLFNRTPSSVLHEKAFFEVLFNKIPSYSHIRSCECLAYVNDNRVPKDKSHPRGRKCVFLGYPYVKKSWKFFDLDTHAFLCSRDFIFLENEFPFSAETSSSTPDT